MNEPNMNESGKFSVWLRQLSPALAIALLAIALLGWQWLETRKHLNALESSLSQRLTAFNSQLVESNVLTKKAEDSSAQAAARIAVLEQQLAESRSQQEALQTLYQEFANNREERVMSEVEQLLIIASEQLQLAGNLKTALLAMQTADMRLSQIEKPQAFQLRKLLASDIARLQALPAVDIIGASLRLETIAENVPQLTLLSEYHPRATQETGARDTQPSRWKQLVREIWRDMRQLVRIERIDHPEAPLLTPEQSFFLRENLRLRLLAARIALLQRDKTTYQVDVKAAKEWLQRYFDTSDGAVKAAIATLQQLGDGTIQLQLPDINASLNEASRYKLLLGKQ